MGSGDGTAAVRTLSDAYLDMMKKKPSLLDEKIEMRPGFSIPLVMRWPALGAGTAGATTHRAGAAAGSGDGLAGGEDDVGAGGERLRRQRRVPRPPCALPSAGRSH